MDYVFQTCYKVENDKKSVPSNIIDKPLVFSPLHRGAFFQFPFRWIYYYGSLIKVPPERKLAKRTSVPLCKEFHNICCRFVL